jgi:hypothetical protein
MPEGFADIRGFLPGFRVHYLLLRGVKTIFILIMP